MFRYNVIFHSIERTIERASMVSRRNRPQWGFAPIVFNNHQIELEHDTRMISRQHTVGLYHHYHTDEDHIQHSIMIIRNVEKKECFDLLFSYKKQNVVIRRMTLV